MLPAVRIAILLLALVCLSLSAFEIKLPRIDLVAAGLALLTLATLLTDL